MYGNAGRYCGILGRLTPCILISRGCVFVLCRVLLLPALLYGAQVPHARVLRVFLWALFQLPCGFCMYVAPSLWELDRRAPPVAAPIQACHADMLDCLPRYGGLAWWGCSALPHVSCPCQLLLRLLAAVSFWRWQARRSATGLRMCLFWRGLPCCCSCSPLWLLALAHVLFAASYDAEDLVLVATAKAFAVVRRVCCVGGVAVWRSAVPSDATLGTWMPRQHSW